MARAKSRVSGVLNGLSNKDVIEVLTYRRDAMREQLAAIESTLEVLLAAENNVPVKAGPRAKTAKSSRTTKHSRPRKTAADQADGEPDHAGDDRQTVKRGRGPGRARKNAKQKG